MKKIGLLCSGGDAPGINCYIRWIINNAPNYDLDICLIEEGFKGLYENKFIKTDFQKIEYSYYNGGTIIKTSRFCEFKNKKIQEVCVNNLLANNIDTLIVVGGNGSYLAKNIIKNYNIRTIGIPETIDNNVENTNFSLGFMTAVETVANSIKALKESAESHGRCYIIEIMGDKSGDLTKIASISAKADICSTPEEKLSFEQITYKVLELISKGKKSIIIAITEKMHNSYEELINLIHNKTKLLVRPYILGFIQRGGSPTALERYFAANLALVTLKFIKNFKDSGDIGIEGINNYSITSNKNKQIINLKNSDFFDLIK
ncbi:ATP-dependent 6-phosphofructokinase [Spiroplasma endosymbiont of Aspidapion aeneum]|uniref:ATP-dependent 6-phosphofructokinase n=1 Tax=Spiroplasma endosymbiont of Aspidapion aeneum TaxID=3066276 RepID=UPI00313DD070